MQYLDILVKLRKIIRSINLESKKIEKEFGISIPQLLVLEYLSRQEDYRTTAKEIKNHLNLNASTVSGILQRLMVKELLAKSLSQSDKRVAFIILTAKGLSILDKTPTTLQQKLSTRLNDLTESEILELEKNIDLLIHLMGAEEIEASPVLTTKEIPNLE